MSLHNNYRPQVLDKIIGHDIHVTRMKGIVASGKHPNAIALFGPTSAGKTTLARAFAADLNGVKSVDAMRDYLEMNGSSERSIEDIRQLQQQAKFKPQNKVRVICIDEAHGLLGNAVAANALLKILETPPKSTMFVLASMEASKFQGNQLGRALLNRCNQFVLSPHTEADRLKQAKRIAKGEGMKYVMDEDNNLLKEVARSAEEMRSLANLMESLQQYYNGLDKKPKMLKSEHVADVLKSMESSDDALALTLMTALYDKQFKIVQRTLLDVTDGFQFITKLLHMAKYVVQSTILEGGRHHKVWGSAAGKALEKAVIKNKVKLGTQLLVLEAMVEIKTASTSFQVDAVDLLSARLHRLMLTLD